MSEQIRAESITLTSKMSYHYHLPQPGAATADLGGVAGFFRPKMAQLAGQRSPETPLEQEIENIFG